MERRYLGFSTGGHNPKWRSNGAQWRRWYVMVTFVYGCYEAGRYREAIGDLAWTRQTAKQLGHRGFHLRTYVPKSFRIRMRGALGNQLWQLAAGFAHAKVTGRDLTLDTSLLDSYFSRYWLDSFDLDTLPVGIRRVSRPKLAVKLGGPARRARRLLVSSAQSLELGERWSVFLDEDVVGRERAVARMLGASRLWSAIGFFQDPRIIEQASAQGFPKRLHLRKGSSACDRVCTSLLATPTVSVHIRLQDFPLEDRLAPEYYRTAVENVIDRLPQVQQTVVFSDEPAAIGPYMDVMSTWNPQLADTDGLTPPELLTAMSSSAAFVSCKSSLSFWAGHWCESRGGYWQSADT